MNISGTCDDPTFQSLVLTSPSDKMENPWSLNFQFNKLTASYSLSKLVFELYKEDNNTNNPLLNLESLPNLSVDLESYYYCPKAKTFYFLKSNSSVTFNVITFEAFRSGDSTKFTRGGIYLNIGYCSH